jgi:hypothetical protein
MSVHLGETQVGQGRGLKSPQHTVGADLAGPKVFEKLYGMGGRHKQGSYTKRTAGHEQNRRGKKTFGRGGCLSCDVRQEAAVFEYL